MFKMNKSNQAKQLPSISVKGRDFLHKMLNFQPLVRISCALKLRVPTTFDTDICSVGLVH